MSVAVDETGNRYGRLVVICRSGTNGMNATWLCRCDCGNETVVTGTHLREGITKSCGCLARELNMPPSSRPLSSDATFGTIFRAMKQSAKRRGYTWSLTKEIVRSLTSMNCYYCGSAPSRKITVRDQVCFYSGIDRVDNSRGYSSDNVVPCCSICNLAKWKMSQEEFYAWIARAYEHRALAPLSLPVAEDC